MDNIYLIMLIALAGLAIADLVVGVSNDAVNFLNSAIGSKAVTFRTIMIVASIGIAFGALSSSGMMEVARKGIFMPEKFYFDEIMIIFMAVMITDILLLDFFNSIGLPTSTTVSIVFELLGAAVCMSLIKISNNNDNILQLGEYINGDKATEIIVGILLSVVIAFTVGAIVQFISRYLLSFNFQKKPSWVAAFFGGVSITSIAYFIIIKGLKGADILPATFSAWASNNLWQFLAANFIVWSLISFLVISAFKTNIYKIIIILGTFALAMAFAGNDLVNFIGVPIAALNSYESWVASGVPASEFSMEGLAAKVPTQPLLLLLAGVIMVLTLWFSEKARRVVKTSVDLSRQDEVKERFKPNWLSQYLVRGVKYINIGVSKILPDTAKRSIEKRFAVPTAKRIIEKDAPAFDMVRAAVNLIVASVLISIATGMKLPLSTTYVTFMVAMGTSLADKAWGSDSAVYRVAGVINVVGGWFMTAITAFISAAILAYLIYQFGAVALAILLLAALFFIIRNFVKGKKKATELKEEMNFKKAESSSLIGVIEESSNNVATVMKRGTKLLSYSIENLGKQDLSGLKKGQKQAYKLSDEMEDLGNHVFIYMRNPDETQEGASRFYLLVQDILQDIVQSLTLISNKSYKHVKNGHKGLKYNQIKGLKQVEEKLSALFEKVRVEFSNNTLENLPSIIDEKQAFLDYIGLEIEKQIQRTKEGDSSPRNNSLYFSILLECKDLVESTTELLEHYYLENDKAKKADLL
ncbi:inorganic phosphate transporter [Marinirhabdus gelatinilytica]|uniref:Phosphate transporter n=1 Tax=Marinirhabdus gelatinilytica TaxID=1703343 RepID=A0A370QIW0_9FLAO|nr:inorganic phosphate transporter [Marinirhabdus gelatinilytica]RDK88304.1 phosphate transporter family protein [Marinirhabdus gelatinilytica]